MTLTSVSEAAGAVRFSLGRRLASTAGETRAGRASGGRLARSPLRNRRPVPRIAAGIVALVASVAVVFGVAAVFLLSSRMPHAPAHASLSGTGQPVVENGIDQALIRNFKILRRPVRPSDRLPAALAQIARPSAPLNGGSRPTSLGLAPDLAREVTLPGTGLRAWLIPGRHGLCWDAEYAGHELGAFCSSLQNSATALAATNGNDSVKTKTGLLTIGLVTDRVLALELMRPHGQRTRVPISDGFYAGYGISGKNLIAITASGSQILPRASSEIVFDAVGSPTAIAPAPPQRATLLAQVSLRPPGWRSHTRRDRADLQIDAQRLLLAHALRGQTHRCTRRVRRLALQHPPRRATTRLHHSTPRSRRDTDDERGPAVRRRALPPDSRHARDSGARKDPGQDHPERSAEPSICAQGMRITTRRRGPH